MCGIVGYIGTQNAVPIILEGLKRLEYRGYDSAGLAVCRDGQPLTVRRAPGKLCNLEESIRLSPMDGSFGIGHTRWATHGRPTEENAHPHSDCKGDFVVVHNGIVENYLPLKRRLQAEGHEFRTETDTEVIAHLLEEHFTGSLERAVRAAIRDLSGVFALAALSRRDPNKIVAARSGPPVVIGLGNGEYFVASDVPAILSHTRDIFYLCDGDVAVLTAEGVSLTDFEGRAVKRHVQHISWDASMAEKGGYRHFMLKEIFEQPRSVRDTTIGRLDRATGRVTLDPMQITEEQFRAVPEVKIVACGTSWHAALAGKFLIEKLARVPVEVDYGSEFRYRDPLVRPGGLTVVISQSGETADTLAAQREARQKGSKTLAICNVVGSMVTREAAGVIYTHAGPEIGVASTKAFTTQLVALLLLAMRMGELRGTLDPAQRASLLQALRELPAMLDRVTGLERGIYKWAQKWREATDFLYLARGPLYPIALEGALKLKEISYIHAEGYPAGEMKHGPIALIDQHLPIVAVMPSDGHREKTLSNLQEAAARDGRILALVTEGDHGLDDIAEDVLCLPPVNDWLAPILYVVPLQLLAYHIAVIRGCDVDQPRNLAKSVTVE